MRKHTTPSFNGLSSASSKSSEAARRSSKKMGTRCELTLRRSLWHRGIRYRLLNTSLPGKPDIIFPRYKVAVFCDGDFWHGRDLHKRLERLASGHNAPYWITKICYNVERDRSVNNRLEELGWRVIRVWETDILKDPEQIVNIIVNMLDETPAT